MSLDQKSFRRNIKKAEKYKRKGLPKLAIEYYNKALEMDPKSLYVLNSLMLTYKELGNINKAIALCEKHLEINPKNKNIFYILSGIYLQTNNLEKAEENIERAIEIDSENPKFLLRLAEIYKETKNIEDALNLCEKILNSEPKKYIISNIFTTQFTKMIDFFTAPFIQKKALNIIYEIHSERKDIEKLEELSNTHFALLALIGKYYYDNSEYEKSIEYYKKFLKRRSKDYNIWHNLGASYNKIGQYDSAIKALWNSIKIRKKVISSQKQSGGFFNDLLMELEYMEEPIEEKEYEGTWYYLAYAHYKKGDIEKVFKYINKALKINPDYTEARELKNKLKKIET